MAYQGMNPPGDIHFATRKDPSGRQLHPVLNLAADGFDIWWNKTFAQHTAVVAQASALMRAHQRVSSVGEAQSGRYIDHICSHAVVKARIICLRASITLNQSQCASEQAPLRIDPPQPSTRCDSRISVPPAFVFACTRLPFATRCFAGNLKQYSRCRSRCRSIVCVTPSEALPELRWAIGYTKQRAACGANAAHKPCIKCSIEHSLYPHDTGE